MKKYIFPILFLAFLFTACDENMPVIACLSCENEETPLDPQDKRVLVEEFTGVRCINCPAGSAEIENLLSIHGERLIAVSIHAEFFAKPYPDESLYDFRTDEGENIINFLGLPEAYPSSVIDRKIYQGEADLQLVGQSSWSGRIGNQLLETAKISMELENTYNATSRVLSVKVKGQAQESIEEEVRLTIMITESGIVDAQLTPESSPDKDLNYVHKHVFRKTLTAFDGDVLSASMFANDSFEETYSFTMPQDWNAANCEVIAFTHLSESSKEVIQAVQEHLAD